MGTPKHEDIKVGGVVSVVYDIKYEDELSGLSIRDIIYGGVIKRASSIFTKKDYRVWTDKEIAFLDKYLDKIGETNLRLAILFVRGALINKEDIDKVILSLYEIYDDLYIQGDEKGSRILERLIDKLLVDKYKSQDWLVADYVSFNSIISVETYEKEISGYKYSQGYLCMRCKDYSTYIQIEETVLGYSIKVEDITKGSKDSIKGRLIEKGEE